MHIKNRYEVRKNGKEGVVDNNNKIIIPLIYDYVKYYIKTKLFYGHFFKGNKFKVYDINGNLKEN